VKKVILVVLMGFSVVGCQSLKRLTTGADGQMPVQSVPARDVVTGQVSGQWDCVSVAGMDLNFPVEVSVNGATLNQYEYELRIPSTQVCFKNKVIVQPDGKLLIPGDSATHAGDHYQITLLRGGK